MYAPKQWRIQNSFHNLNPFAIVPPQNREIRFCHVYFLVPKKTGDFEHIWDHCPLRIEFTYKPFYLLIMKQQWKLVQLGNWFSTTDLKDMEELYIK